MVTKKVSGKSSNPAASNVPAAASVAPVAQPAVATPARRRAARSVKVVEAAPVAAVAAKAPAKPRAPRVARPAIEVVPVAKDTKPAKPAKIKNAKLVRDSYTMPQTEHAAIATLKKRCLNLGVAAKKSEVLRAALAVLVRMSDIEVAAAIQGLSVIKTGRPAKHSK